MLLTGVVCWSTNLQSYTFQPAEIIDENIYERYEVIVPSIYYLQFREIIRATLGIYATVGLYDEQCPPSDYRTDIIKMFTPTYVRVVK
jgi:hypothetical protein